MKKSKIISLALSVLLLVGVITGIAISASAAGDVTEQDWISAPNKALKKCEGGDCDHTGCDYVYSFAVVGDTQNLNIQDVRSNSDAYMATLYNWILNNQQDKNIQYVLGLGDITQAYHKAYSSGIWVDEWANAAEAVSLLDGKIGYSLVRGNHDIADATDGFNGVFGIGDKIVNGVDNQYYEDLLALSKTTDNEGRPMAGFRNVNEIEETYRKLIVGDHKYIIVTLDWYPNAEGDPTLAEGEIAGLTWLDNILTENSDYQAIITLHSFIWYDGSLTDDIEDRFPYENLTDAYKDTWGEVSASGGNASPDDIWNVLKTHENVEMILCGHVDSDDIVTTQLRGDNGNTVTCLLIDGQTIDSTVEPVGLVAMFYVSADGTVMNVEYISTVRAAKGQPAYLRNANQYEVTLDYENEWVYKSGTYIPTEIYNAYPFHVTLDDDSDPDTVNTLFGSYNSWDEALAGMHAFNGTSNMASRKEKTWNIVMSCDYTFSKNTVSHNKAGNCPGRTVVNLDGHTLTVASGAALLPYYNQSTSYHSRFGFENGNVALQGTGKFIVTQHGHTNATNGVIDINLTNVNFKYASGATGSIVTYYGGAAGGPSNVNLTVTDCTIDASAAGALTLFDLKDSKNNSNVNFTLEGGSIVGSTVANTTFVTQNWPGDTVTFVPSANGGYTTFTYSDNAKIGGVFNSETEDKYLEFASPTEKDGVFVSTLVASNVILTKYGYIPTDYQNATAWPFLLFKDGKVIHASSSWKTLIDTDIKGNATYQSGCTLLLQRDYNTTEAGASPSYFAYIDDLAIDLGGNVFTRGSYHMFQLFGTESVAHNTSITVTNGTIKTAAKTAPIVYNNNKNNTATDTINMTLNGITFDVSTITGSEGILAAFGDGTAKGIDSKIVLNDCTIYRGASTQTVTLFKLHDEKEDMAINKNDIHVEINGGKLVADSLAGLTFASYNPPREGMSASADKLTLGKGAGGSEFTVELPVSYDPTSLKFALTEGNHMLVKNGESGAKASYVLRNVSTAYGDLPVEYLDETAYPFVVFKGGVVIYAFSDWYSFIQTDVYKNAVYQSGCTLLLRRDYTTGTDSDANSNPSYFHVIKDMTIDLGGHVFARGSKHMFQLVGYGAESYNVAINVKNGTIKSGGSLAPIGFNNNSGNSGVDYFNLTFDNVIFDVSVNTTGIVACFKDGDKGSVNTITLNNCRIVRGSSTSNQPLFSLSESSKTTGGTPENKVDVTVVLNGGTFEATSLAGLTFAAFSTERESGNGSPDKIIFNNGFTVRVPKAYAVPAETFAFAESEYEFTKASEDSTYAYYTFISKNGAGDPDDGSGTLPEPEVDFVVDGYGTVPVSYKDKNAYPFLLFYNNKFVEGYTRLIDAVEKAKTLVDTAEERAVSDTVYIVMRTDVYSVAEQMNLATLLGKVVVDLQGYTLYNASTSEKAMMNTFINYSKITADNVDANLSNSAEFTFKNGTLKNESPKYHMIGFDVTADTVLGSDFSAYSAKEVIYNFDNVKFQTTKYPIVKNWQKTGEGMLVDINLKNCIFDYTGAPSGVAMIQCQGYDIVFDITVDGLEIIASNFNNNKLYTLSNSDKIRFVSPVTLTQTTDTVPNFTYGSGDSTCTFVPVSSAGGKYVYKLGINTEYGFIDVVYSNAVDYPFVIFKADGTFVGGYKTFAEALSAAGLIGGVGSEVGGADAVILVRTDLNHTAKAGNISKFYNNVVIDLGGHKVTMTASFLYLRFDNNLESGSSEFGRITVKNGSIFANYTSTAESIFRTDGVKGGTAVTYNVDMENVHISTSKTPYVAISTAGNANTITINSTFTNCVFDFTQTTAKCYMFASGNAGKINATLVGGKIIGGTNNAISFIDTTNSTQALAYYPGTTNDSIKLLKNVDGDYIQFVLTSGTAAPSSSNVFLTDNGVESVFVKISESESGAVYELVPKTVANLNYTPKMSLTLDSNLIVNVYVPAKSLVGFTFAGVDYNDLEALSDSIVEIDGESYYKMSIPLPSSQAAKTVKLVVTISVGGTTVKGTFTFSIPKYAEKLLADTGVTATEKTLVRDVLAYIKAAYAYFKVSDPEAIAKIDSIIGADYSGKPEAEGSSLANVTGLKSATFVLDATPTMRFYLPDGADASRYEFFIGGNRVNTKVSENGDYIDIEVYAYALCETVTYTIGGVEAGSYHINAYCTYVSGSEYTDSDKAELVALTESFWLYCQSARAYRNSVIGG